MALIHVHLHYSEIDTSDIKWILLISSVMVPDQTIICK